MHHDLNTALDLHQRGEVKQAAEIYQGILARQPDHVQALNLLGVAALQVGKTQRAIELIGRAVTLQPGVAAFHANLAEAYRRHGNLERAVRHGRMALRLQPTYAEAANNLGLALLAQGHADDAVAQLRDALRLDPNAAMVHNNLGNALRLQGDRTQALTHFRRALELDVTLAEAHSNLGQFQFEQHALDEALRHCREAVRLRPRFAEAHSNLGNVLRELGQLDDAKACYAEALRLNPNLAMVCNNMGQALQEEDNLGEAIAWYQLGLQREPDSARIHANLASALEEKEQYAQAAASYEIALRLDPNYAEAHNGLGFALHAQGNHQEALHRYREAIRLKPELAAAHSNLGTVLEELSDFDQARACFREALRHDPNHTPAYAQLATLERGKLADADLDAMRSLLTGARLSESKRSAVHFGVAQVLDAKGDFGEAAEHLRRANSLCQADLKKRGQAYVPAEHSRFVDELIAAFTPAFYQRVRDFGVATERPIFILGLPRSGTTLTEQILASHSHVFGAGELRLARETFESLPSILNRPAAPLVCVEHMQSDSVERLATAHLDQLGKICPRDGHIADKMPDNYLYLGFLAVLFPRARFIHCSRDLRDVAVSCWMTNFRHIRWACDQEHIAARFGDYERLMAHWRDVLPVPVLEVPYEETVADLEGTARRMLDWCGLEWEPGCLAFHETQRPVRTASKAQVRQPLYRHAVARWKNYEPALAPLFDRLLGAAAEVRGP